MTKHATPREKGTAVVIPVVALLFVILMGFVLFLFMKQSEFAYSEKLTAELISARTHEQLVVTRQSENSVLISNNGSIPVVVTNLVYVSESLVRYENEKIVLNVLENYLVNENEKIGVVTVHGNVFWEVPFDFSITISAENNGHPLVSVNRMSGSAKVSLSLSENWTKLGAYLSPSAGSLSSENTSFASTIKNVPSGYWESVTVTGSGGGLIRTCTFTWG